MAQEDVLRFQIAVNHLALLKQIQRREYLLRETADDAKREPAESMRLDELIKVHI